MSERFISPSTGTGHDMVVNTRSDDEIRWLSLCAGNDSGGSIRALPLTKMENADCCIRAAPGAAVHSLGRKDGGGVVAPDAEGMAAGRPRRSPSPIPSDNGVCLVD